MSKKWTTKDGTKIAVADMSDSHILNTLRMLRRNDYVSAKTVAFYMTCSPPNGEMAQMAFESEQAEIFAQTPSTWVDIFEQEIEKRGLTLES